MLQYVDYAYGDHQDLAAKTGPWWMFWDQPQYIGVPTRFTKGKIPKGAEVIADQLVLWYYYDLANAAGNRASPGRLSFTRIADELGNKVIQRQVNFQTRSSGSRYFQGFVTPSFPRRGKKIKAEYFSQSFKAVDGTVTLVNPSYKTYPQWTPPPLPASQTRNGVTLSITKCFLSHCIYKLYPKWKFGQGREQTEKESTKELAPCISTSFHVSENGKNKDSEYEIMTGETIDATGNKTTDYFSLHGESKPDATSKPLAYDFKNGVCIGEKALKFVLQVVRSQNAPLSTPGQNRIENLIPPTSNNSLVFKKFVFNRVLAEAAICLGGENVTLSGQYSFNYSSPCLILKVPFSEKLNYNPLVRAKDSAGNLLSDGFSFGDFKYFTGNS